MIPFGVRTDVGYHRSNNEDAYLAMPAQQVFAVADGVGGQEAGEVASQAAVDCLARLFAAQAVLPANQQPESRLREGVYAAHAAVLAANRTRGLEAAATFTTAWLRGHEVIIAHVGDSAALLVEGDGIRRLTSEHTVVAEQLRAGLITVAEAQLHPKRNMITRALGQAEPLEVDVFTRQLPAGATLLLCTDGLTSMMEDDEIAQIVRNTPDPQECADRLVVAALRNGGRDNVTVIVVKIPGNYKKVRSRAKAVVASLAVLVLLTGGAAAAANRYLSNRFFIGEKDGRVAIFRGVQHEFVGLQLSSVARLTSFPASSVVAPYDARLRDGIPARDLDDANGRLADLTRLPVNGPHLAFVRARSVFALPLERDGRVRAGAEEFEVCRSVEPLTGLAWLWQGNLLHLHADQRVSVVSVRPHTTAIEIHANDWPFSGMAGSQPATKICSSDGSHVATVPVGVEAPVVRKLSHPKARITLARGDHPLAWSPDNRWILVRRERPHTGASRSVTTSPVSEIWTVSGDGRMRNRILEGRDAEVAPDAAHVLVWQSGPAAAEGHIVATDMNGRNVSRVAQNVAEVFAVWWGDREK